MQKLTFTRDNQIVEIGYDRPFQLQGLSGISDIPVTNNAEKGYLQDGQTSLKQILGARTLVVTVWIIGDNIADVYGKRRDLIRFFNPKAGELNITYQNDVISKSIKGRVAQMPTIGPLENGQAGKYQVAVLSVLCDDPFFLDLAETVASLALVVGLLEYPAEFTSSGIEYGLITDKSREINNDGDVDCPVTIEWQGAVTNPVVHNETTGEFIKVNITLTAGQKLIITTNYGNKKVILVDTDGSESNAFGYIDLESSFFSLVPGSNIISYDADSGADGSTLYIHYKNRFVGV